MTLLIDSKEEMYLLGFWFYLITFRNSILHQNLTNTKTASNIHNTSFLQYSSSFSFNLIGLYSLCLWVYMCIFVCLCLCVCMCVCVCVCWDEEIVKGEKRWSFCVITLSRQYDLWKSLNTLIYVFTLFKVIFTFYWVFWLL